MDFQKERLKELIVFFAKESKDDGLFGSTKLNKLLFMSDFLAYGYFGHSITGTTYINQEQGPTPSPAEFLPVRDELVHAGRLEIKPEDTYFGTRKRPIARGNADTSLFEGRELDICRASLEALRHLSGSETGDWSHRFPGWLYTERGQEIPYQCAFVWEKMPSTKQDFDWARQVAKGATPQNAR